MRHVTYRILFGLVLIAAIAGIALLAFNAGVTRGEAISATTSAIKNNGQGVPLYGMPYWRPFPFFGFGFLGFFALLFLLFVVFGAARRMLWGPRFGWLGMHSMHGPWGDRSWEHGVPPMMAEMHRRMHAAEAEKPADATAQKQD